MPGKIKIKQIFPLLFLGAAAFVPLVWVVLQSLARNWRFPALLPVEFDLRAWNYVFDAHSGILPALINSFGIAAIVTLISILLAITAARSFALYDFRGKNFLFFVLLLPILSPSVTTATGGHSLFLRYGLTDSFVGVILIHLIPALPYCLLTLIGGFARFEIDFEVQAQNLGASGWQIWRFVILPALAPSIAVSAVFAFLISWSQYLTTLLIGGGQIKTLPLLLISFQRGTDEAVTAALTLVFLIPVVAFLILSSEFWRTSS